MKPEILIVEDDLIIATQLQSDLKAAGYQLMESCRSGEACLQALKSKVPDLILMDIKLDGELTGIETAREARKLYRVPILFLTEMHDQATVEKASKTAASSFLIKPFQTPQLLVSIDFTLFQGEREFFGNKSGFFKGEGEFTRVVYEDIVYVEAGGSYCDIYLADGKKITFSKPLNQMMKRIPYPDLIRIHKSHSVNKNHVTRIMGKMLFMGDKKFDVGETYQRSIKKVFDLI